MVHPIIDDYYNYNPYHHRSSKFVQDKGLSTNEKQTTNGSSPSAMPNLAIPPHKKALSPTSRDLHASIASTLVSSSILSASPARSQSPLANGSNDRSVSDLSASRNSNLQKEAKHQESGSTKKHSPTREEVQELERALVQANLAEPKTRTAYGNPLKIAQYFPELNR
jgi:glutamine amidotransferase